MNEENKLTPGSNMRWETKFILPEHREAIVELRRRSRKQTRPELDDDELHRISQAIERSYVEQEPITVETFGDYGNRERFGIVNRVDQTARRVRLESDWISFSDIVDARRT